MKKIIFGLLLLGTITYGRNVEFVEEIVAYGSVGYIYKCNSVITMERKINESINFVRSDVVKSTIGIILTTKDGDGDDLSPYVLITKLDENEVCVVYFNNLYDLKNASNKGNLKKLGD